MIRRIEPVGMSAEDLALGLDGHTWDRPAFLARGQLTTALRMPTAVIAPSPRPLALPAGAPLDLGDLRLRDPLLGRPMAAEDFLNRRLFNDALLVMHRGRVRHESYRNGLTAADAHVAHSVTKTLTTMMVGIAIDEGRLDAAQPIATWVPELAPMAAWQGVTLQHVLDMAAGLATEEHYEDPASMYWRYARAVGYYDAPAGERIGALAFVLRELDRRANAPGTVFNYASYLTNLLPIALARAYGRPALELYDERLVRPAGTESAVLFNMDATGLPIVEGQSNLTLRDLARWASLYLHDGRSLAGEQVVPAAWVRATIAPDPERRAAFARGELADVFPGAHYRNKTWVLDAARRRFAMLGIHGQFAWFDLERALMIVGFGSFPEQVGPLMTTCLRQLWDAIADAVER